MKKVEIHHKTVLITFCIVILGAFYWYEIRPAIAYSKCSEKATELTAEKSGSSEQLNNFYNITYKLCLRNKGIEK